MTFRMRNADKIVGLFVILAVTLVAVLLFLLGANQRWFARDYRYYSRFPSASGLSVGMPILFKGFQIGRVESVRLSEEDDVDVDFVVYDTYLDRVRENSILELVTSPIGLGSQLLFQPGVVDLPVQEGAFIPSLDTPEGKDLVDRGLVQRQAKDDSISQLLANVNPLLENVNSTVVELQTTLSYVNAALSGAGDSPLTTTVADVSEIVAGVRVLVSSVVPKVDQLTANLVKTSEALADPTGLVPKLLEPKGSIQTILDDGNRLFDKIDSSFNAVQGALTNLEDATSSFSDQMPRIVAIIEEARSALVTAEDLMEGVKNNPLIKGGVPQRVDPSSQSAPPRKMDF